MNKILKISIVIVVCLIVILGAALLVGSCTKKDVDETTTAPSTTAPTTSSTTQPTTPPVVDPECTDHVDADTNYVCDVCGEELEKPTTEKVYVITTELNLRKNPNETGVATVSVTMDTELERIGTDENGWSKVIYEGKTYYVDTDCITTQKPLTDADFTTVEETVYVIEGKNPLVFSKPSHIEKHQYSEQIGTLISGQAVTRLGVATKVYIDDEGKEYTFAKVRYEFNGTTFVGYVTNDYLTTEAPANPDNGVVFVADTSVLKVIAEVSIHLRTSAEFPADNVGGYGYNGQLLQATHVGTDANNRTWYKVIVEKEIEGKIVTKTYYVIYDSTLLEIQTPNAQ